MLKIRPFNEGPDDETFIRLYNAGFSDYEDNRKMTLEELKKTREAPNYDPAGLFLAESDGEVAGMVEAFVDKYREDKRGFVRSLTVFPQFRKRGIAKKLVAKALESLKDRGMQVAEAWAQTDREACMHIYESFGFRQVRAIDMMKRALDNVPCGIGENTEATMKQMSTKTEDMQLLNMLDNESFKEHPNFRPRTVEETKYAVLDMPWYGEQNIFFAMAENEPVGYVNAGIDVGLNREKNLKYGWVLDIGVLKPYRRKGIGARLMVHAMQVLRDKGMTDALLYVDETNPTRAVELYEKVGFKVAIKSVIYELALT